MSHIERQRQLQQEEAGEHLFANRVRVYPKSVTGPVRRFKWAVLIVCLGLLAALIGLRFGVAVALTLTLFLAAGYVAFTQFAFNRGVVMPLTYPVLAANDGIA